MAKKKNNLQTSQNLNQCFITVSQMFPNNKTRIFCHCIVKCRNTGILVSPPTLHFSVGSAFPELNCKYMEDCGLEAKWKSKLPKYNLTPNLELFWARKSSATYTPFCNYLTLVYAFGADIFISLDSKEGSGGCMSILPLSSKAHSYRQT